MSAFVLVSPSARSGPWGCRRSVVPAGLALAGVLAAAALTAPAAQAAPALSGLPSKALVSICGPGPLNGSPCANQSPPRRNLQLLAFLDWRPDPTDRIGSFSYSFTYDPALLTFQASASTLLCDLRAAGAPSFCPDLPAGSGTTGLGVFTEEFTVDQTGLTFREVTDASGLPAVAVDWLTPSSVAVTSPGERNFLALAFELRAPLNNGVTVTYTDVSAAEASLTSFRLTCADENGIPVFCGSNQPSASVRINNPVPGPLGLGGLSALLWQSRRLRRRLRR